MGIRIAFNNKLKYIYKSDLWLSYLDLNGKAGPDRSLIPKDETEPSKTYLIYFFCYGINYFYCRVFNIWRMFTMVENYLLIIFLSILLFL